MRPDLSPVQRGVGMMSISFLGGTTSNILAMIALFLALLGGLWMLVAAGDWLRKFPWKGNRIMKKIAEELQQILDESSRALAGLSEKESGERPAPGKWSKKEILGHLIDSASNNHQRFVRAQLSAELKLAGYEQEAWVSTQQYQNEPWLELVQLWRSYNLHLLHLVSAIPEAALRNHIFIGEKEPVTLEFLVQDYLRHLKQHLKQILG
jgi:DinB superfamily